MSEPLTSLTIFSPARSIEHIELCAYLKASLDLECELSTKPDQHGANYLLMFDCSEVSAPRLHQWLGYLHQSQRERKCVLINAERQSPHEQLINWPQIQGIFYRSDSSSQLLAGLQKILNGSMSLPENLCYDFVSRRRRPPSIHMIDPETAKLTRRELQILECIYAGHTNACIADWLALSEHTIKSHLYSAYRKLGINSRLEACTWMRDYYPLQNTSLHDNPR
ncbi:MAG: hypothetical protein GYB33_09040 [Gammaproteobacteria bacterium]|uniref:LuxR C-terminal-related transcriptional regulator n=1 Tax=Pseudomaricurvus alcaniphilus TaxID=1166482 RepID=UPI00140A20BD|nr:LuxR C-terminal-related transcriptional regulator [Pseudomaricurvus alcaniphilus]MBR9910479.1 hypothetical protein [Gammaproteobacteria bacterium]NHN39722.1 hypothetical protein [Pseudomaricurvus alcaniphilus]